MRTIAGFIDGRVDSPCPECGTVGLKLRYIGDPATRIGFNIFWCMNCFHGIHISRSKAPESADFRSFDDPNGMDGVPEIVEVN